MRNASLALCFVALMMMSAKANDTPFEQANKEFANGNFKAAVSAYEAEVAAGQWSANLFYDLGNAYFRSGDLGRAILSYERALRLDLHHPEAAANLALAREQARSLQLTASRLDRAAASTSPAVYSIVAAASFWLAVFLVLIRPRGAALGSAMVAGAVCAVCVIMCYAHETGITGTRAAVIVGPNVEARVATADSARSVLALPPGSDVLILQQRGDWSYAVLPTDQRGWIPADSAEKIRL